jgi:hypothetical protein
MTELLGQALQITAFVGVMMIAVEYGGVFLRDRSQAALTASWWRPYVLGALLGAVPGCLGAFGVVALYTHRRVSLGVVVSCMIATSGDEAFVMLVLFPDRALLLTAGLVLIGITAGMATDRLLRTWRQTEVCPAMVVHDADDCRCFPWGEMLGQLIRPSASRGTMGLGLLLFVVSTTVGWIGPAEWNWVRATLLVSAGFGLFVVLTVPEHFLEEHLWRHIALRHGPRIFMWTLGALAVIAVFRHFAPSGALPTTGRWLLLGTAGLLGIVPESGPHLLFVTLYDQHIAPLSVLVASSIVQDGHGMLPLLAESRRDFIAVKIVNLVIGLAIGVGLMMLGV